MTSAIILCRSWRSFIMFLWMLIECVSRLYFKTALLDVHWEHHSSRCKKLPWTFFEKKIVIISHDTNRVNSYVCVDTQHPSNIETFPLSSNMQIPESKIMPALCFFFPALFFPAWCVSRFVLIAAEPARGSTFSSVYTVLKSKCLWLSSPVATTLPSYLFSEK